MEFACSGFNHRNGALKSLGFVDLLLKIEFDHAADGLYIQLTEGEIEKIEKIKPGMIFDYDANGNVMGVELLYVSKRAELPMKSAS